MGDNTKLLELLDPKFPLVWKECLPKDGHFQMQKTKFGRECAICERPFSVFFWRLNNIPFRTCICQICAKSNNVCQVSLLDLDTGIPVMVRNKLIQTVSESFDSKTARWFHNRLIDRKINNREEWYNSSISEQMKMIDPAIIARIQQIIQQDPYLSFRKAPVCQKWLLNECINGDACLYSHELPAPGESSPNMLKYGIKGRYQGTVDPNALSIIQKLQLINPDFFKVVKPIEIQRENDLELPEVKTTKEQPTMTPPGPTPTKTDPHKFIDDFHLPHLFNGRLIM